MAGPHSVNGNAQPIHRQCSKGGVCSCFFPSFFRDALGYGVKMMVSEVVGLA